MTKERSKKVLLTGFDPFGGAHINPSEQAARALGGEVIAGRTIVSATLPCVFGEAFDALAALLTRLQPELVICVGQATGRSAINLERIAINLDDAAMPDNKGAQPRSQPILGDGPAAFWSTLPLAAIARELANAGIEAALSQSAGTFVCNHVFYRLMETLQGHPGIRGGFIHIPLVPEQAAAMPHHPNVASMPLRTIVEGLRIAVRASLLVPRQT